MRHLTLPGEEVAFHQAQLASIAQAANLLLGDGGQDRNGAQAGDSGIASAFRFGVRDLDVRAHGYIGFLLGAKSF